jgi:endoglucanase
VTDPQPAADSDLDVAWALALGAQRFDEATLLPSARAVASAILEHETVVVGGRRVLVAGEWARSPIVVDPSYLAPSVMRALEGVTGDARWSSLADDSVTILRALTDPSPHLPPDWATVDAEGDPHPTGGPAGGQPQYGYDAIRVPLWTGTSCAAADRTVAARMWPFLRRAEAGSLAAVYTLQGTAEQGAAGAPAFVAAAAAAGASSDGGARDMLLDRAAEADAHTPTYYGAALVALGRALLTTDLLNACSRA